MKQQHPATSDHPGDTVRRLRLEQGITQEALAFKADVTIATLSRIERGVTGPAYTTMQAILAAHGMKLELVRVVEGGETCGAHFETQTAIKQSRGVHKVPHQHALNPSQGGCMPTEVSLAMHVGPMEQKTELGAGTR